MAMMSNHELSKIRKRNWFFVIRDKKTTEEHKKNVIEKLKSFATKHQDTSWALNPNYSFSEGVSSARVVIMMRNNCSLLSLKKAFGNPDCNFDLNSKSIISYLCSGKTSDIDKLITSDNWSWEESGFGECPTTESNQGHTTINITIENLYMIVDEDGKKAILSALKN